MTPSQPHAPAHGPAHDSLGVNVGAAAHIPRLQAQLDAEQDPTTAAHIARRLASQWIRATRSPGGG